MMATDPPPQGKFIRLIPDPPLKIHSKGRVAVTTFGLSWAEAEPVLLAAVHYNARRRRASVLVLTDVTPAFLVTSEEPVELLPTRQTLPALDAEEWHAWVSRRWHILQAKWHIKTHVQLGQGFDDFVSDQTGKAA